MAEVHKVADITAETPSEFETALDAIGTSDWKLIQIFRWELNEGLPAGNANDGKMTFRCFFSKTI